MNEQDTESWIIYSGIWLNVLVKVLKWPPPKAKRHVAYLRKILEKSIDDPNPFGFFYDPPSSYLFRAIMDKNLEEMFRTNKDLHWYSSFQLLIKAISGGRDSDMAKEDFDWIAARKRYCLKRKWLEKRLALRRRA